MAKTWYGHHIENIKGEDYVLFKDYLELDKEIERLKNNIEILQDDLDIIGKELDLEEGSCFEDILEKLNKLKEGKE